MRKIGIFGSSGLAREIADLARELNYKEVFFIDLEKGIDEISGVTIISENEIVQSDDVDYVIGIGDGKIRKKIYEKFPNLNYVNLLHPSITIGDGLLEKINTSKGNIICAGSRLTNNIEIGNFNFINLNVTVGHDCIIDDFVTILSGANISGNVHLMEGSYIGTGAVILQGKSINEKMVIGEFSTVGAGAVVVKSVESNKIVKGVPAK